MKKTMKRFLSILLTVALLLGSFVIILPATILPVSADSYTNVPANTAVTVNGVKIRYDRYSGNDDGYVHVFADGTIEFKIRHGDMVWFPDVVMTNSSAVHGEVTVISGTYQHSGFAYNVAASGDGSYASAMIAGYNNGARVRIAGDTKANLGNNNGGDGYGSGGTSKKPVNGYITGYSQDTINLSSTYENIRNSNMEIAIEKTAGIDLYKSDGKVYVDWLAVGYGAYHSASYDDNTSTVPYLFAGGSVGYGILYQKYNDGDKGATADHSEYIIRRIENLYVTNCTVAGATTERVVLAMKEYADVPANTTVLVNGVNVRYDRYSGNDDGYVHVYPSGKIELKIRHGDMVWFPDVVMTDDSLVHGEVTVLSGTYQHSGFAYHVAKSGDTWASTMIAGYNNGARVRIAGDTKANLGNDNGGDGYGSGGDGKFPVGQNPSVQNLNNYYDTVKNVNSEVAVGKTVGIELQKKSDGKVYVDWLAVGYGAYHSASYTDSTSIASYLYAGGSVGYSILYQNYNNDYIIRRIENLYVTHCSVSGSPEIIANLVGTGNLEILDNHTNVTINGQVWRFDPTSAHTGSYWAKSSDGKIFAKMECGDLLWMPEVSGVIGSIEMDVKLYVSDGGTNASQMAGGIAYNIDAGANGTWGDSTDTAYGTNVQTSLRRRIGYGTYTGFSTNAGFNGGTVGDVSGWAIASGIDNSNYWYNSSGIWEAGRSVHFGLFREDTTVTATFGNTIQKRHTTDYYTIDGSNKKPVVGPFGFQFVWTSGANIVSVSNVTYENLGASANLSLDGKIKVNFGYYSDPARDLELVARNGATVLASMDCDATKKNVLSIPVNAKEMTDTLTITVEEGGTPIAGGTYSLSVKQYAEALAAADSDWADLMEAMLDYGAAAQQYFGYNTSNLAADISGGITFNPASISDDITFSSGYTSYIVGNRVGLTLSLESGTDLNLYVRPLHYYDQSATVTAASAVNSSSVSVPVTLKKNGDFWEITISDLKAEDLNERFTFTVTVKDNSGSHNVTITCSALNWVKSAIAKGTANSQILAKAVGVYAAEAENMA